jgi:hypothetical protein
MFTNAICSIVNEWSKNHKGARNDEPNWSKYVGSFSCRKGCGQPFLTETARDVHEETCNGGSDEDNDSDDQPDETRQ